MTSLSDGSHRDIRERRHGRFFWWSLNKSFYLHIESPHMLDVDRWFHFALPAREPRETLSDIMQGMAEAHAAWLQYAPSVLLSHQSHELRDMLGRSNNVFHMNRMNDHAVAKALYNEVKNCSLLFVPDRDEMRKCVRAIREQRERSSTAASARAQQPADADIASSLYGNSPRVPQNLGGAQPFVYKPDALSDDIEQLAKSTNNPRYAAKMLGYHQDTFGEILHRFKPDNGLGPADNVIWHDNGDVYFNGDYIANFHDWAN
ncbi:hypothetical protein [Paraburkholderia sp. CI3]|uniref:hypothetical protein n=1 Tax=Paraburkholderia sp. CI3 TaxID=2991060 RepID=UPI003D21D385